MVGSKSASPVSPQRRRPEGDTSRSIAQLRADLEAVRREASERAEQLTAIGAVLRAVASASIDLTAVLDTVAQEAARLTGGSGGSVWRVVGDSLLRVGFWADVTDRTSRMTDAGGDRANLARYHVAGRAVVDRRTIHVPDLHLVRPEEEYRPEFVARRLAEGTRSLLTTPLLRDGEAIGCLSVRRTVAAPFTESQIRLLESFADQAVVAIENARLFRELQESNQTLHEALEQQTATAEVLRVIVSSPTDLQSTLDAIASRALVLSGSDDVGIVLAEGDYYRGAAHAGTRLPAPRAEDRYLIDRNTITGVALLERRAVHVHDVLGDDGAAFPGTQRGAGRLGVRTALVVPLSREKEAVGAIFVRRAEVRPYTAAEIALLQMFADQAVIAIENARLFSELQERLAEQTALGQVTRAISGAPTDLRAVLDTVLGNAATLATAGSAVLFLRQEAGIRAASKAGPLAEGLDQTLTYDLDRTSLPGIAILDGRTERTADLQAEPPDELPAVVPRALGVRSEVAVPLLRDGHAIGAISVSRAQVQPFTDQQVGILETFADQAVIAIENARLFGELQQRLEELTATAEVLRTIAASPADLHTVLEAIAATAGRLCAADDVLMCTVESGPEGDVFRVPVHVGSIPVPATAHGMRITRESVSGLAVVDRRTVHIQDILSVAPDAFPISAGFREVAPWRTALVTPLLRDTTAIGAIMMRRLDAQPFTERQVALLQSFADQAVIAIENTRLFSELRERDERRARELERARGIQARLLPEAVEGWPGVLEVAVRFRPAVETSGDFYDVFALPAATKETLDPLQIAVGDVAGKGMSAALVTALARSALRASLSVPTEMVTPAGTLRLAGRRLHQDVGGGHFVACALAIVEPPGLLHRAVRVRLSNAAQVPVLLAHDGDVVEVQPPGDRLPLGVRPDGDYRDAEVDLLPGDVLVFATDGLPEAPNHTGALFGFERLAQAARAAATRAESAEAVAEGIWADVTSWCGEESHHDDMTLLVLRVPLSS